VETAAILPTFGADDVFVGKVGPWGSLEHLWFSISPPVEFVELYQFDPLAHPWRFPSCTRDQVAELFARCGVTPALASRLLLSATDDVATQGVSVFAPPSAVAELPEAARRRLYLWLGQMDSTSWHANAFRYCGSDLAEWLHDAPLEAATIDLIRPYVYRHGPFLMFADLPAVAAQLGDRGELIRLTKTLAREKTLLIKLRVRHRENIEPLSQYWGRGGRQKEVRPILESLAQFRQGQSIDIIHLLPTFVRRLLYTYPRPAGDGHDQLRDCHWSSLNFFAEHPDDSLLNLNTVVQSIERNWRRIEGPATLGDLVLLHDDRGNVFHSAIYVADDVLFTKNGPTLTRPWMLMTLDHLRHYYPQDSAIHVKLYRPKAFE
jgi:hypothetical protein